MEYRIERLSSNNIDQLKPLFRDVFGHTKSIDFLKKKYSTHNFGAEYIGYLAFDSQGAAAAFYGVIPCHLIIRGGTFLGAQSADTMTHPNHRNKGLFTMLAEKTYSLAKDHGVTIVFGFPNQHSTPGFQKLGWKFMDDKLQTFIIKVSAIAYARIINRSAFAHHVYFFAMQTFFQTSSKEWRFENNSKDGLQHDKKFLGYKTYNRSFITELAGVRIWFRPDGRLKIGDVYGLTDANAIRFIKRIKSFASRLGCQAVVFMTSKNSRLYNILIRHITALDTFPIGYMQLVVDCPEFDSMSFEYCDIDTF